MYDETSTKMGLKIGLVVGYGKCMVVGSCPQVIPIALTIECE